MAAVFRLARVLRLRTQLRERAQDDVARARAALAQVRDAITAARAAQEAVREAESARAAGGMTGDDLQRSRAYEAAERVREELLVQESTRLAEELVRLRDALLARRREERQLEVLRERAMERAEGEEERAAMQLLDDLALRRERGGG
jgi:flagellar export protein FliJ